MRQDRGQTLPDFAFGMAIFIVAILFVAVIVPQLILPYDGQESEILTQRLTADLANSQLVEDRPAGALAETPTTTFFESTESEVKERHAIPAWYSLNVTLRDTPSYGDNSSILCTGDGEPDWIDETCQNGDQLALGDRAPEDNDAVSTGRVTLFTPDRNVVLEVRLW